jgi:hypothetical protein
MNDGIRLDNFFCAYYNRTVDNPARRRQKEYQDKLGGIKKRKQGEIGGSNGARGSRGTQYQCGA